MQFPYGLDLAALAAARQAAGVAFVLINLPAGRLDQGELGLACLPDRRDAFARAVTLAADTATAIGCPRVNCLSGKLPPGESRARCWEVLVENVRWAAERLAERGIQLLVEPLNRVDNPGVMLGTTVEGDALLDAVRHANLALQYDVYHARAAGEDWLAGLTQRIGRIGHVQFSDYPGRGAPGTGDMDLPLFFETIDRLPYPGWTGAEYRPGGVTLDSLGWRAAIRTT
jgi:hydroxypyruvate isomerase